MVVALLVGYNTLLGQGSLLQSDAYLDPTQFQEHTPGGRNHHHRKRPGGLCEINQDQVALEASLCHLHPDTARCSSRLYIANPVNRKLPIPYMVIGGL